MSLGVGHLAKRDQSNNVVDDGSELFPFEVILEPNQATFPDP